jgi:hypothetical protein
MFTEALSLHPDLLLRQHRLEQDRIRLTYSKNQALPQLDLQASYGYNGLGESASEAYDKVQESDFVSWSVGLQLRFPMGGGRRSLHELKASRLRSEQAEIGLEGTRIALANSLATNARRMSNNTEQARNYQQVASLNQVLLDTELARLEAGKSDSRKVLDTEEKLTEALDAEATSLTRCMVAQLEFELSTGALLKNRGLDPMTNPLLMDDPAADAAPLVEEIPRETPPVPDQPALDQPVPRQSAIAPEPIHVSKTEASTVRTVPIRIIMNEAPNTPVASERQKSDVAEEIPPDRLSFLHQPVQRKAPAAPESKDDPHPSAPSTGTEPVRIPLNGRP